MRWSSPSGRAPLPLPTTAGHRGPEDRGRAATTPPCGTVPPGAFPRRFLSIFVLALAVLGALPGAGSAQEEERPDTVPPDTVAVPIPGEEGDTLGPETGGAPLAAGEGSDELADSSVTVLPAVPEGLAPGWERGVWEWDREGLLAVRALTLAELLAQEVPGMVPVRGGDYGTPRTVTAFGTDGGRIRVFMDGFELVPLEGSIPDLARIPVASAERIRVERLPGEVRVEITSLRHTEPRAWSLVEAGTGDLETNFFRGSFAHPRAFGGGMALVLDRVDTQGPGRSAPGGATGLWARYARTFGETQRWGLAVELRRFSADPQTERFQADVTRTDWVLRGRMRIAEGIVGEAFWGRSNLAANEDDPRYGRLDATRGQGGVRVGLDREAFWGSGAVRLHGGDGVPGTAAELRGGLRLAGVAGAAASLDWEDWEARSASRWRVRAWTEPLAGFSVFGMLEDGARGVPVAPPLLPEPPEEPAEGEEPLPPEPAPEMPDPAFTERSALRAGATFRWRDLRLSGAWLRVEADSLRPFQLPLDSGGIVLPGGTRTGWEAEARLPLFLLDGLAAEGSVQFWDDEAAWSYLPKRIWEGRLAFHDVFLDSENLEIWSQVGVRGRDPMLVPVADLAGGAAPTVVPWYQSWYGWLQIRIVTVRIFVLWENFTIKRDNLDIPGTALPETRAMYGVRWTLWN